MATNNTSVCYLLLPDRNVVENVLASYYVNIVLNTLMAPLTVAFNIIIIIAIWKTSLLHTSSNFLLCNLAVSDVLIGIITQPFYAAYKYSIIRGDLWGNCGHDGVQVVAFFTIYALIAVSFGTLTAMSVDRYLAIRLGLQYRLVVTTPRVVKLIIVIWIAGILVGSLQFFLSSQTYFRFIVTVMGLFLAAMTFAYVNAFRMLKRHQVHMSKRASLQSFPTSNRIAKFEKTLHTVLYILGLILLCSVPQVCVYVVISIKGLDASTVAAKNISAIFILANSCLNPMLYFWKILEVRRACVVVLRKVLCLGKGVSNAQSAHSFTSENPSRIGTLSLGRQSSPPGVFNAESDS